MNEQEVKKAIEAALQTLPNLPLADAASHLFEVLGYTSDRKLKLSPNTLDTFVATFAQGETLNDHYALPGEWKSIDFLFQLTDDEIRAAGHQQFLMESQGTYNGAVINSFLFFALELQGNHYTRTALAGITRELNRLFDKPVIVLFRHGETLTLAVINRRPHKRDEGKFVLEKVTLIQDIQCSNTHRAHIEILFDLSLAALHTKHGVIFCWFLKEKRLLHDELFDPRQVPALLNDFNPKESTYYQAILQNLFFATLSREMDKREFRKNGQHFMAHNLYRYRRLLKNPDAVLKLFATIPFMNGGLFECLDKTLGTREKPQYVRIDGFSDRDDNPLNIPNDLFFNTGREVDLSQAYGAARYRKARVSGLIHILERYKFTVAENTPIEEEIALDPELLGKVFENLLAAYNPETGATARKQTGSFYTLREIVNYMVDESLLASLQTKLEAACPSAENNEEQLRHLFAYNDQPHQFTPAEVDALIEAIDHLKILDPACGSGAFPMGVLHKLVFVLSKLDPGNQHWKARQLTKAAEIPDATVREHVLDDIEQTFGANELDYGRKLFLIENCIYGVDIQPIAVQIAKLRCFISLVVNQKMNAQAENLGIRSLPNLETRFVAANTLMGLERPLDQPIRDLYIEAKESELRRVRERHFLARTPVTKARCREQDANLRAEIAELLASGGWDTVAARKLALWDPYDQNASAAFFDAEWMFGESAGFDITIGNPPYVRADEQSEWNQHQRQEILASKQYETLWEKWDLYVPFIERSYTLLRPNGVSSLIVSDAFCHSKYAQKSQNWFLRHGRILRLDFCTKLQIFEAAVHNLIYFFQKADGTWHTPQRRLHYETFGNVSLLPSDEQEKLTYRAFFPEDRTAGVFHCASIALGDICYISKGMVVHADEREARGAFELRDLVSDHQDRVHSRSFVEGKHLERWLPAETKWLEWDTSRAPALFSRPTFPEIYTVSEKLISVDMAAGVEKLRVVYDNHQLLHNHSAWSFVPWNSLHGVRNNSLKKAARYRGEKPPRPDLPSREELEETSRRFAVKYLLGVMNSAPAREFLRARRRSNIHLYPDDWKKLPIPDVPSDQQKPIIGLVDEILTAKLVNPAADFTAFEADLDARILRLYNLTPDEIRLVEASAPSSSRRAESPPGSSPLA